MSRIKKKACIDSSCVACGCCLKDCPAGAISIYKGMYVVVTPETCVGCGRCVAACPAGVIEIKTVGEVAV